MATHASQVTHGIRVEVRSEYSPDRSDPAEGAWFFLYRITITNEGNVPARLLRRHWVITNAEGQTQEVRGDGVVGAQPHLRPGESFDYVSGCPLSTPFGAMQGSYTFVRDDGTAFEVSIPVFTLALPHALN
jgi:ApaG protein